MKNITIIGGGNIGTLMAANIASKGLYKLTLLTSDPTQWSNKINVYDGNNNFLRSGVIDYIFDNPKDAFKEADLIICTLPSNVYHQVIETYIPYIPDNAYFGVIPGMGGKEFPIFNQKQKNIKYFAFQRVPGVARIIQYGKSVADLGERELLHFAANNINDKEIKDLHLFFENLFGLKCELLPNVLSVTLTPSNPILHTSRLYGLGQMSKNGVFSRDYLFYKEWDDLSSEIILGMDNEVQNICNNINGLDLSSVKSLTKHYEAYTIESFTNKIRNIESLSTIKSPLVPSINGYKFDFSSRYFNEDFYFGLYIIQDLSKILHLDSPYINRVVLWHQELIRHEASETIMLRDLLPAFNKLGIRNEIDLIEMYK